jgi:hypothetical protein
MNRIIAVPAGALLIGVFAAAYAELPPPTPEQKAAAAAKAKKDTAEKAKAAREVAQAQDTAVANYKKHGDKKNEGSSSAGAAAEPKPEQSSATATAPSQGADHANATLPDSDLTPQEAQTEMPKPGQANDHSTTARDAQNSAGR